MKQFSFLSSAMAGMFLSASVSADLMQSKLSLDHAFNEPYAAANPFDYNGYQTGQPWHIIRADISHGAISVVLKRPNVAALVNGAGTLSAPTGEHQPDSKKASLTLSSVGGRQQQ